MTYLLAVLIINVISTYSWESISSPDIRNHDHAVVYDPNNDLFFIIGGDSTGNYTNMDICLAFDPKTNTWDTKAPMPTIRARHRAAYISGLETCSSSKVRCEEALGFIHVLCGKDNNGNLVNTHEVYDIKNDCWSTKAPAPVAVSRSSVVPWRDSLVYLMGGYTPGATTGVYYYDTKNDSWHSATPLPRALHGGGADIKGDSIFIIGGADGSSAYSNILIGEINPNDPADINWSWGDPLPLPSNQYNNGLAIKNNKAYMIGGLFNDGTNQVWEYDIQNQTWTSLPDYPTNIIIRGDFAKTRSSVDSDGIVYCFMGDTTSFYSRKPTDECFKLVETAAQNDAGMYAINSPVSDTAIGSFVHVEGEVKNYGDTHCSFETSVNIYDPDSIIVFTDMIQLENVAPLDIVNIYFGSFQLQKSGLYTVEMFTYAINDLNTSNDSLKATFDCYGSYYWQKLPSSSVRNHDHAVVYDPINDLFFITGGDSTGHYTNMDICLAFDPKTNTWDTKAPMPTKRARHRAAYINSLETCLSSKDRCEEVNGFIHVFCGKDNSDNHINTHEVYYINSNCWCTKAPAPLAVARPSVVTWRNSLIYLMGGYDASHTARTEVYYYDPETDSWHSATPLPRRLHGGGTGIKGDSIFIIGGADGSLRYTHILIGVIDPTDPSIINWSWGEPLPIYDNNCNMLAIKNNKAYMIGGQYNDCTNEVWEYNIQNETWTSLPDYPTPFISRGDFAKSRDCSNSLDVVYCFMGDTSNYWTRKPTDECYLLVQSNVCGSEDNTDTEETTKENSIEIINNFSLTNEISLRYNFPESSDLKIRMYDISGREILSQTLTNVSSGQHTIPIDKNLKNGIYLIRIEAVSTVAFEKVILIR